MPVLNHLSPVLLKVEMWCLGSRLSIIRVLIVASSSQEIDFIPSAVCLAKDEGGSIGSLRFFSTLSSPTESRSAWPAFPLAFSSPISFQKSDLSSFLRNLPGGFKDLIIATTLAAANVFSILLLELSLYLSLC
jgi:hypothetical protein